MYYNNYYNPYLMYYTKKQDFLNKNYTSNPYIQNKFNRSITKNIPTYDEKIVKFNNYNKTLNNNFCHENNNNNDDCDDNYINNQEKLNPNTSNNINLFGFNLKLDDLIIILLILFLFFDTKSDLSLIIVLGLMLFNINLSSINKIL